MGILDTKQETNDFDTIDDKPVERVLIYSGPKMGKTWAYCSIIDEELKKDPETRFFIINTDNGIQKTFNAYFKERATEVRKSVDIYFAADINKMIALVEKLRLRAKKKDWLIYDLISDSWDMAQEEFEMQCANGDMTNYLLNVSKDPAKFGTLDGKKWVMVKRMDNLATRTNVRRPFCNVVGIAGEKDMDVAEKIAGKIDEQLSIYKPVGAYPAGSKQIGSDFDTIVYIQGIRQKQFVILGDRGTNKQGKVIPYEDNFWKKFNEVR